jgi:predicted kinase
MCPDEWVEQLLGNPGDFAERDRLHDRVEDLQWDLARALLPLGTTVIMEFGFWAEEERSRFALEAVDLGAKVELHYLEIDREEQWRRIQARNALTSLTWVMALADLEVGWRVFQPPTPEELEFYDDWSITRVGGR